MKNFRDLDTLTIYLNISKIRLLDQIKLCRNASIEMDPSKNNRFSAEEAMNYIPHTKKKKKVPICEMLEYFQTLLSYMLSSLSQKLKIMAWPAITTSLKLELFCQYVMPSRHYIVTKSSMIYYTEIRCPPLFIFLFSVQSITKRLKFNKIGIYMFNVEKKRTKERCENCSRLKINASKRR